MRSFSVLLLGLAASALAVAVPEQIPMDDSPVHITAGWGWDDCGLPTDAIHVKSISVSPDPPQPGKDLTVNVVGEALEQIEEGAYADVTVKLGLVKILTKQFDVCEEARNANATVQCPVQAGEHQVTQTVALPKEIPKAKFQVNIRGYTVEDDDMLCINLHVDFMKRPFLRLW